MIARALIFLMELTCGMRKMPIDFGACRVISNGPILILLNHFHFIYQFYMALVITNNQYCCYLVLLYGIE